MGTKNNLQQENLIFWTGIALQGILIPFLFWLRFGRIDGFALSLTAFLLLLSLAFHFIPKLNQKYGKEQVALKVVRGRFDWLGVVWLLSIPFAPFFLWIFSSLTVLTLGNWKIILGIKAALGVALPCVSVLPLLKYVRGSASPYALLILLIGTSFPVFIGWNSMRDFLEGPKQEEVAVVSVERIRSHYRYQAVPTSILEVTLSDGKILEANSQIVTINPGLADIVYLEHVATILKVK